MISVRPLQITISCFCPYVEQWNDKSKTCINHKLESLIRLVQALVIWTSKQVWLLDFVSYRSNFDMFFLGHEVGQWRNEKVYSNGKQILIIYNSGMHYPSTSRPHIISPEKIAEMQKLYETFADDVFIM